MDRPAALTLLEALHTFPSDHTFRVIVRSDPGDADRVLASLAAFCGLADMTGRVVRVPSSKGNWTSLRLALPCESAAKVLDIYAHLQTVPEVVRSL